MNKFRTVVFYTIILFTTSNVTYAQPDFFTGADMKFTFCPKIPDNAFPNFFKFYTYTGFYRMHTNTSLSYYVWEGRDREYSLVTVDISNPEIAFGYGFEVGSGRLNLVVDQVFRFPIPSKEGRFRLNTFFGLKYNHELTKRLHLNASIGPRLDLFVGERLGVQWGVGIEFAANNRLGLFAKAGSKHGYGDFVMSPNEVQANIGLIYNIRNCNKQPKHRQTQQPRYRQITVPCPAHRQRHWERPPSVFNRVGN